MYFLRAMQKQKARQEIKIAREKILFDKLPELSVQFLELTKERRGLTIVRIVEITGSNRNTVKKRLQTLVAAGHLTLQGIGKGTWHGCG
jgi:predicted HTH transcriptional regulator